MRRALVVLFLLGTLSCRQACGLDPLEAGGGGAGASAMGGGGNGGQSSGGSMSSGGATTTGGMTSSSAGGAGGSGGAGGGCTTPAAVDSCVAPLSGPSPCLQWDACTDGAGGAPDCGSYDFGSGLLRMNPAANTGFWDGSGESLFYHSDTAIPANTPFVAITTVRPFAAGTNGASFPTSSYALAGLVVRDAAASSSRGSGLNPFDWHKAEFGTLSAPSVQGIRVARHTGAANVQPEANRVVDDLSLDSSSPRPVWIAVCRDGTNMVHSYQRAGVTPWSLIPHPNNLAFPVAVEVGMVTAVSSAADIEGEFSDFRLVSLPLGATAEDCLCYLQGF